MAPRETVFHLVENDIDVQTRAFFVNLSPFRGNKMEIQVQELLERIRNEGIESAKQRADEILLKAQTEASEIVANAKRRAEEAESESVRRIESLEAASRESLVQASRDAMIALKQSVQKFLEACLSSDTNAAFDEKLASQMIPEILKQLAQSQSGDVEVLLSKELAQKMDQSLAARLSKEISKGVSFRPYPAVDAGFRVAWSGSAAQYDFSTESIAQVLSARVNSMLGEYLKEASGSLS